MFPAADNQKYLILLLKWVGYYRVSFSESGHHQGCWGAAPCVQSSSSFPSWSQGWNPCWGPGGSRAAAELQRLSPTCSKYNPPMAGSQCLQPASAKAPLWIPPEPSDPSCRVFPASKVCLSGLCSSAGKGESIATTEA